MEKDIAHVGAVMAGIAIEAAECGVLVERDAQI